MNADLGIMDGGDRKGPDDKDEPKKSLLEKLGAGLPIALTMLATTFASMSTGELQQAMFWRSYAAQDQAKATSQWCLAGFKRDRALICESTSATLLATAQYAPPGNWLSTTATAKPEETLAAAWLRGEGPPRVKLPVPKHESIKPLLDGIRHHLPEKELLTLAAKVPQDAINTSLGEVETWNTNLEAEWDPIITTAKKLTETTVASTQDPKQAATRTAARFDLEQRRYRAESFINQQIGFLYEARVRVSTAESDRHRKKSQNFFYAMLAAQVGATIASLALARKKQSMLWLVAGLAGIISIIVAAVVLLPDFLAID